MVRRYDDYYQLALGDNIGDPKVLNSRFSDIDLRIGAQEDIQKTWQAAIDVLQQMGVDQVNDALFPVFQHIQDIANLGAIFTASSDTEVTIGQGLKTFIIDEDDRASFAPAAFLACFVADDLEKAMLGDFVSYDNVTGELVVNVGDRFSGTGTGSGWTISAASATDNAAAAGEAAASAADAHDSMNTALAVQSVILSVQSSIQTQFNTIADDASGVSSDKATVQSLKATVQTLHDEVVANINTLNSLFLGSFATDPTTTNTGAALTKGMLYFNTAANELRAYNGTTWYTAYHSSTSAVDSFNGRTGGVTPADGDYTAAQVVVTPSGGISQTRVSTALSGLDTRIAATEELLTGYDGNDRTIQLKRTAASGEAAPTSLADGEIKIDEYGNKIYWFDKVAAAIKAMPLLTNPLSTARQILTTGLASGGGDLTGDRTITVPAASQAEAEAGTDNTKAMTPLRVAQAIAALVSTAWGSISGKPTTVAGYGITDAYTKSEVDAADALALPKTGGTMTGDIILNGDPTNILHPVTKRYADNLAAGLKVKDSVLCATAAALPNYVRSGNVLTASSSGALVVDGISPAANDRVLVKNEANAECNGIYVVTDAGDASHSWVLTRASDFISWAQIPGAQCWVNEGATNGDQGWVCTSDPGGTLNTTAITFTVFFATGAFQSHSSNLDAWAAIAPAAKQDALGYTPLNATAYTAADVLAKVKTVDGSGSGLDADTLDGRDWSFFYSPSVPPPVGQPSTGQVGAATAGLATGAVGSYAFLASTASNQQLAAGATVAGSSLFYAGIAAQAEFNSGAPGGTWRLMGRIVVASGAACASLWLRIA